MLPFYNYSCDTAVILAVTIKKETPPRLPPASPTGLSYLSLWDIASDCWEEDAGKRLSIFAIAHRLEAMSDHGRYLTLDASPLDTVVPAYNQFGHMRVKKLRGDHGKVLLSRDRTVSNTI